jgi:hypothetical protein
MSSDNTKQVPEDFPRSRHPAAVSGLQMKVPVRLVDGTFVDGWTNAELFERYDACIDLVEQLTAYCRRKLVELPGATLENLLPRVRRGVLNKGWDLTDGETDWIMARVATGLSDPAEGSCAT